MSLEAIHRIIEQRAALQGDTPAIVDGGRTYSYRWLNAQANIAARWMMREGLRRGGHVIVLGQGVESAVELLAVLKCGASYSCGVPAAMAGQSGIALCQHGPGRPDEYLLLASPRLEPSAHTSANLPVLTRGTDVACVVNPFGPRVDIPHAAVVALHDPDAGGGPVRCRWDAAALEMWLALMAGATLHMPARISAAA